MKCAESLGGGSSMSNVAQSYSLKFRLLALVVNTADLINERSTSTLSISHALLAPVTLSTTYIFLIIMIIGEAQGKYASDFFQIYSLVSICSLHIALSIIVFGDLTGGSTRERHVGVVLNGVLPIIIIMLLIADLIALLFSKRGEIVLPHIERSTSDLQRISISILPRMVNKDAVTPVKNEKTWRGRPRDLTIDDDRNATSTRTSPHTHAHLEQDKRSTDEKI